MAKTRFSQARPRSRRYNSILNTLRDIANLSRHSLWPTALNRKLLASDSPTPNVAALLSIESALSAASAIRTEPPWHKDGGIAQVFGWGCLFSLAVWSLLALGNIAAGVSNMVIPAAAAGAVQLLLATSFALALLYKMVAVRLTHGRLVRSLEARVATLRESASSFRSAFSDRDGGLEGWMATTLDPVSLGRQLKTQGSLRALEKVVAARQSRPKLEQRAAESQTAYAARVDREKPLLQQFEFMEAELLRVGQQILEGLRPT